MGAKYIKQLLMDEGNYFTAVNATLGTASTYALRTSFTSSQAMFIWRNPQSAGGKSILVDRIKLILSTDTAPVGVTQIQAAMMIDPTSRDTSAAATLKTTATGIAAVNGLSTAIPIALLSAWSTAGMITTTYGSSARLVGRGVIHCGLPCIGDEYVFNFGPDKDSLAATPPAAARSTSVSGRFVENMNPCVIAPAQWGVFHLWIPGAVTSTPAFEYEVSWWEI